MTQPLILIPARMGSTRLADKPLALIAGEPMIVHVWRRAMEAGLGPVVVACDDDRIKQAIERVGGAAIMTRADHPSGSDRIWEAAQRADPDSTHEIIINMQGDLPTLDAQLLKELLPPFADPAVDMVTLAAEIHDEDEKNNPSVVKPVIAFEDSMQGRALYFSRARIPANDGPVYHHIGIYAYRRAALERFVTLPPSPLEKREKLEQLRALEAGMRIAIRLVKTTPLGVDTPADLEQARQLLGEKR